MVFRTEETCLKLKSAPILINLPSSETQMQHNVGTTFHSSGAKRVSAMVPFNLLASWQNPDRVPGWRNEVEGKWKEKWEGGGLLNWYESGGSQFSLLSAFKSKFAWLNSCPQKGPAWSPAGSVPRTIYTTACLQMGLINIGFICFDTVWSRSSCNSHGAKTLWSHLLLSCLSAHQPHTSHFNSFTPIALKTIK